MSGIFLKRRVVLAGFAGALGGLFVPGFGRAQTVESIEDMAPGEYTWHPERQANGQVAVVVSIPQQRVHVYRNGIRIGVSTCSTGKPGHETPTGVFVVLQKDKHHHSSTYNNAPMPNMNRLTWSGIALHAGQLPGYPASHGCVRLPMEFSADLFGVTHLGTPVIISGAASDPFELTHPGLVLGGYVDSEFARVEAGLKGKEAPPDWKEAQQTALTTLIVSSSDRKAMLLINETLILEGPVTIRGDAPLGDHVLVLKGASDTVMGMHWAAITHSKEEEALSHLSDDLLNRINAEREFTDVMARNMHPGMVAILTDLPLAPDQRSGRDFVILNTDEPA
jgi:hypothetical protein